MNSINFDRCTAVGDLFSINNLRSLQKLPQYSTEEYSQFREYLESVELPKRATQFSAAYDLAATEDVVIAAKSSKTVIFGFSFDITDYDFDYVTNKAIISPRSSLAKKKGLILTTGFKVFDEHRTFYGEFYNFTEAPVKIERGERIAQCMFTDTVRLNGNQLDFKMKKSIQLEPVAGELEPKLNLGLFDSTWYIQTPIETILLPGIVCLVKTKLKCKMAEDEVLIITPQLENPLVRLANGIGVVDSDYYGNPDNDGEIGVLLLNLGPDAVSIPQGTVIAKANVCNYLVARGDKSGGFRNGGYGSTG